MRRTHLLTFTIGLLTLGIQTIAQEISSEKPRILISTDIGGTDPDDNQSMIHFLMYSYRFRTEGLISSPSYGEGSKEEIIRMIDLYEKDLPILKSHQSGYPSTDYLKSICKQGRKGAAPYLGFNTATEGSDLIIQCAKKKSDDPLWILVWGGLDDLAQALHDAPEIAPNIRVYWIGGPNKKWSTNSYAYIADNFHDLWMIESNAAYRGFFSNIGATELFTNENYFDHFIKNKGAMGQAFGAYYDGRIKMGDTPSLLYTMHGELNNPKSPSWGGSFVPTKHAPKHIFTQTTDLSDSVAIYTIIEFTLDGPELNIPEDSVCFQLVVQAGIGTQTWDGYYLGKGKYGVRYAPKKAETIRYSIQSDIETLDKLEGAFVVKNQWSEESTASDYFLGDHWYTESYAPEQMAGGWHGAQTVLTWRQAILEDWAKIWSWFD